MRDNAAASGLWRVSAAVLARVVAVPPAGGARMVALERKATAGAGVRAQPFGGAARILDPGPLRRLLGEVRYDSPRSEAEADFRILIAPEQWRAVRDYCLRELANPGGALEADPCRELEEEFVDTLGIALLPQQYAAAPAGFVVENTPAPTGNVHAAGLPTVRVYRIFEVRLTDPALVELVLAGSALSDAELLTRAEAHPRGRANAVLALPLDELAAAYRALPPPDRFRRLAFQGHTIDPATTALLDGVEVPQLERKPVFPPNLP